MAAEPLARKVFDVAYVKGLNQKLNKDNLLDEVYVVLSVYLLCSFLPFIVLVFSKINVLTE
jgi:hypothetical protein